MSRDCRQSENAGILCIHIYMYIYDDVKPGKLKLSKIIIIYLFTISSFYKKILLIK